MDNRGGHNKKFTLSEAGKIVKLRMKEVTYEEIAEMYECTASCILNTLFRYGMSFPMHIKNKRKCKMVLKDYYRYGVVETATKYNSIPRIIKHQINKGVLLKYLRPQTFKVAIKSEEILKKFIPYVEMLQYRPEKFEMPEKGNLHLLFSKDGKIKDKVTNQDVMYISSLTALKHLHKSVRGVEEELCKLRTEC